ncbi:MAG: hypothetical protein CMP10_21825 [Zetaproteobacteria bacterium]|nr:hypothetical protein [Pseudobdellovibrionaceae bacterium]
MDVEGVSPHDVKQIIAALQENSAEDKEKEEANLDKLEALECWNPMFRILSNRISSSSKSLLHFVRLARIQNIHLDDVDLAAQTCRDAVKQLGLSYADVQQLILIKIIREDDFNREIKILLRSLESFLNAQDKIYCLERLCLIFEKKVFDEGRLEQFYRKLIDIDPNNQKALRYFKVVFTQNCQWEEVTEILKSLQKSAKHHNDACRLSMELAAVYLYQLDQPKEAIKSLEKESSASILDTSNILFDANSRLGNWKGCLKVLHDQIKRVSSDYEKGILWFKIGEIKQRQNQVKESIEAYSTCFSLAPSMVVAVENIIEICIGQKKWALVVDWLYKLEVVVEYSDSKEKLKIAVERLESAMGQ